MSIDPFEIQDIQDEALRTKLGQTAEEYDNLEADLEAMAAKRGIKVEREPERKDK